LLGDIIEGLLYQNSELIIYLSSAIELLVKREREARRMGGKGEKERC
jgi:hypothetical protein